MDPGRARLLNHLHDVGFTAVPRPLGLDDQAELGAEPWVTHWRDSHGTAWRNDADWIDQRQSEWQAALLD